MAIYVYCLEEAKHQLSVTVLPNVQTKGPENLLLCGKHETIEISLLNSDIKKIKHRA